MGNTVSSRFNTFLSLVNLLSVTGEYGNRPHSLEQSSNLASQQSTNISTSASSVQIESQNFQQNITAMSSTIRNVNSTSSVANGALNQAWSTSKNLIYSPQIIYCVF